MFAQIRVNWCLKLKPILGLTNVFSWIVIDKADTMVPGISSTARAIKGEYQMHTLT